MRHRPLRRSQARLAHWLVSRYPAPWRARYEDEVLALLDETSIGWKDVADLARGMATERLHSLIEPGDRPTLVFTALVSLSLTCVVVPWLAAVAIGRELRDSVGPLPSPAATLAQSLSLLAMAGLVVLSIMNAHRHGYGARWCAEQVTALTKPWLRLFGVFLIATALDQWAMERSLLSGGIFGSLVYFGLYCPSQVRLLSIRIQNAVHQLSQARNEMKWALLELARCERLNDDGHASPLREARDHIERIDRMKSDALASLHSMGYRARYR